MDTYSITVLMNREPSGMQFLRGYQQSHPTEKIGTWLIEADSATEAAHAMFRMGNLRDTTDLFGDGWPARERSMSVGDVLVVEGDESPRTVLACAPMGWTEIHP